MNIGFFGDSYLDINENNSLNLPLYHDEKTWNARLIRDLEANCISSGVSGTNQFYAIKLWEKCIKDNPNIDVAIFTFTWHHRLYLEYESWNIIHNAVIQGLEVPESFVTTGRVLAEHIEEIDKAINAYFSVLYSEEQSLFNYEQQIKWILQLPDEYPNIKFIFIPNTETGRTIAKKHFNRGVLLDFALGTISEMEGEDVNVTWKMSPVWDKKGHLWNNNHEKMNEIMKEIINKYEDFRDKIYIKDYSHFETKK